MDEVSNPSVPADAEGEARKTQAEYTREWKQRNPEKVAEQRVRYRDRNREKERARKEKYRRSRQEIKRRAREAALVDKIAASSKACWGCGVEKPKDDFYTSKTGADGYQQRCKQCVRAKARAWQEANPDRARATNRQGARAQLLRRYGITQDDYDRMLAEQGGVCAVCRQPETDTWRGAEKPLSVDHCHATGKVRGLLCGNCNRAAGNLRDRPDLARALGDYLSYHVE